jgi:hypothetical protein
MKDISINITNESLDLLEKQTAIVNKRESVKAQIDSYLHKERDSWDVKSIPENEFANIDGAIAVIKESNSAINKIVATQNEIRKISNQEKEIEKKIKSLKSNSTALVWIVIVAGIVAAYFYFKNQ